MMHPELLSYVRNQLAADVPRASIQQSLVKKGWAIPDINEAFAIASPQFSAMNQPSHIGSKVFLSGGLIVASAAYALWQYFGGQQVVTTALVSTPANAHSSTIQIVSLPAVSPTPTTTLPTPVATNAQKPNAAVAPDFSPTSAPVPATQPTKPTGRYTDGTYTGSAADAYYGTVQVLVTVQNGNLSNVKFLQYPDTHSTSVSINRQAMPYLTQEAVRAQSAQVNTISGATFTSQAFQKSLASALVQAKI